MKMSIYFSKVGPVYLGAIFLVLSIVSGFLYDYDLKVYRKLGWFKLADKFEAKRRWLLPLLRVILVLVGIGLLILGRHLIYLEL